jgi:hypothetical protein
MKIVKVLCKVCDKCYVDCSVIRLFCGQAAHIVLTNALMSAYVASVAPVEKVVQAVR